MAAAPPPAVMRPNASAKKPRPVSADVRRVAPMTSAAPSEVDGRGVGPPTLDKDYRDGEQQLLLLMYVVGGREVGQVTVFRRPISVWRLDLTKTF